MRRVIKRYLQHLEVEKNASPATIAAYQHDLKKFHEYLVQQMGDRFLPGDVSRDHILKLKGRVEDRLNRL